MNQQANISNAQTALLTKNLKGKRMGKSILRFSLSQIYPPYSQSTNLNVCGDPDCGNYGQPYNDVYEGFVGRNGPLKRMTASLKNSAIGLGVGSYKLNSRGDKENVRNSSAFEYEGDVHSWSDNRSMKCQHQAGNAECGIKLMILSNEHFEDELDRLTSQNDLLTGPRCGHCGTSYLSAPEDFAFNGANGKKVGPKGKSKAIGIRVVHKPCKGKKGSRFTVSQSHIRQKDRRENIRILKELVNDTSINALKRLLVPAEGKRKVGVKKIYDRIFWLEKTLLAYENAQLAEWHKKQNKENKFRHTRIAHDDIVLGVNWETSRDRRITALNCSVSADIRSGYVFRIDVDFDPNVDPVSFITEKYLDEGEGQPQLRKHYKQKGGEEFTAPLLHFQRPSGRYDEAALFASAESHLRLFAEKVADATALNPFSQTDAIEWAIHDAHEKANKISLLANKYFNFQENEKDSRNAFSGIMTRNVYTKAAHLAALKGMVPYGKITLVGEQESTMARTVPHIFRDMIEEDRFEWAIVSFDKEATKPIKMRRSTAYNDKFRTFRHANPDLEPWQALEKWTAKNMKPAVKTDRFGTVSHFPISNLTSKAFPSLWMQSPIQASGETNKVVGFPILSPRYRARYKRLGIDSQIEEDELQQAIARRVVKATIQPASTFMNSLRERLTFAKRAGGRSSRSGDTFVNGGCYNPRVLIAILNIFRVHYNFFELREYVSPINKDLETEYIPEGIASIAIPGTDQRITVPKRRRLTPIERTPAERAGILASPKEGVQPKVPDVSRILYQPWLFHGTPLWAKLQGR